MRNSSVLVALLIFLLIHFNLNGQQWPKATPQSQSMNADSLKAFDEAIASGKYGYVDGMIIIRHGQLIYRKNYKYDYHKNTLHNITHTE